MTRTYAIALGIGTLLEWRHVAEGLLLSSQFSPPLAGAPRRQVDVGVAASGNPDRALTWAERTHSRSRPLVSAHPVSSRRPSGGQTGLKKRNHVSAPKGPEARCRWAGQRESIRNPLRWEFQGQR
jgi:hypothetical protein